MQHVQPGRRAPFRPDDCGGGHVDGASRAPALLRRLVQTAQ